MAVIVVVDNYDSFTYNLEQYLGPLTPVRVVRNDQATVEEILAMRPGGLVISPGPGRPEDAGVAVPLIRAVNGLIPILGVCLGHQAIAQAYGGIIIPAPQLMHGKADEILHHQTGLLERLPNPFMAGRYHSLAVDLSGAPDLVVDAVSRDGTVMAISHRTHPVFGIQFHPESVLTPDGITLLMDFMEKVTQANLLKGAIQ